MNRPVPILLRYTLPRLQDILFIGLFIGVIGLGSRLLNLDGDLGRHLTVGQYILDTRKIPTRDIFSYTMTGEALTPHEWLAEVIYAAAYRLDGLDGVVLLCGLILATTFTLCFIQCYQQSNLLLLSIAWAVVAAAASSLHWLARPHLFTLLFILIWVGELERIRAKKSQRWWILPGVMLLWANTHGAFLAGFVVWVTYLVGWVGDARLSITPDEQPANTFRTNTGRTLLFAGLSSFLTSLVNPSGLGLWTTSLGYIQNRYLVGHTAEYLPPNFQDVSTWPFLGMIALSLLLLGILGTMRQSHTDGQVSLTKASHISITPVLLLVSWTVMGLYSVRNVPIYALIAAPILCKRSAELLILFQPDRQEISYLRRIVIGFHQLDTRLSLVENSLRGVLWPVITVILIALVLAGGVRLDFKQQGNQFDPAIFPVKALDWLQDHPAPARVFNAFTWGGYLLYRDWPATQVFIDGQTDFYGETLTRKYEQVVTLSDGWREVLDQYQVNWIILPPDARLIDELRDDPNWRPVYQDQTATILFKIH